MGLGSYFKYGDELAQLLVTSGRLGANAEQLAKLADNARAFFAGKTAVTGSDVNDWIRTLRSNPELSQFARNSDLTRQLRQMATNNVARNDFVRQFDNEFAQKRGAMTQADIERIARTYGVNDTDPLLVVARRVREQAAQNPTPHVNPTPNPGATDEVGDAAATGGRTEPNLGDDALDAGGTAGRTEPSLGDDVVDAGGDGARTADEGAEAAANGAQPNFFRRRMDALRNWAKFEPADGNILPDVGKHWTQRLATIWPSSLVAKIPLLGDMFSHGGGLANNLPSIATVRNFIRPGVTHVDSALRSSGTVDAVMEFQNVLKNLSGEIVSGNGGRGLSAAEASSRIDEVFKTFADTIGTPNGPKFADVRVEIDRLLAELESGHATLSSKYPGMSGLTQRQSDNMREWLNDIRGTLFDLERGADGTIAAAERYKARVAEMFKSGLARNEISTRLDNMLTSRYNRVGWDPHIRADGAKIENPDLHRRAAVPEVSPLTQDAAALERQIEGGAYSSYDRVANIVRNSENNAEAIAMKLLNMYRDARFNDVQVANNFYGMLDQLYDAGYGHEANRVMQILVMKKGAGNIQTFPEGLIRNLKDKADAIKDGVDDHRRTFYTRLSETANRLADNNLADGPRAVEKRWVAPFAEFFYVARGFPMQPGPKNFWTGLSVPTVNQYLRVPLTNTAKEAWAYMTGGRTAVRAGAKEGEVVVAAGHSGERVFQYNWWFRKAPTDGATDTGFRRLIGSDETGRSMFGVLGRDGFLDRMPWYMKMPMQLASGGMLSTQSRVGLTLPGKILLGGVAVTEGIERGSAAIGWDGFDNQPGLQVPWIDPRAPINVLQQAGLGFYDFWWDDVLGTGSRAANYVFSGGNRTGELVSVDIDAIPVPLTGMNVRNWILSWTDTSNDPTITPEQRQETQRITDQMRARAQTVLDQIPAHGQNIANQYQAGEQLLQKLRDEATAARQRGETDKATRLDTLAQQVDNDQMALRALMTGAATVQSESQTFMQAFREADSVIEAEEALTQLETRNTNIGTMSTQARQAYEAMRARVAAVPEAAAALGAVTAPAVVTVPGVTTPDPNAGRTTPDPNATTTPDPNAGRTTPDPNAGPTTPDPNAGGTQGGPVFIGPTTSDNTRTGTPDQQLAAVKAEAARAARNAADSARSSQDAVTYLNDTVRQIRELQEYARDNGGRPAEFDAPLAEAQRLAQEANIAAQAADQANRRSAEILAQVNTATVATLEDARTKMQEIQGQAQTARQAQQRAAQANTRMRETLERNTELDEQLHRRRQEDRTRSVTGFVDGGNNGILSNLTRDRGQPGGTSFLGQAFNSISDALGGVRDWWTRDVARYASRSEGGKMMYQGANIALGGIAALMGIGLWNSTIGKWTGTQISGGMKLLVVGAVLLYMFRGSSDVGDRLDRMAGRYRATGDDYAGGDGGNGPSPFRAGNVSVQTLSGGTRDVTVPGSGDATRTFSHDDGRVFSETVDRARREANLQGSGGSLPAETGEVYHRAIRVTNSDGRVLGSDVVDFRLGGAQQELVPAQ